MKIRPTAPEFSHPREVILLTTMRGKRIYLEILEVSKKTGVPVKKILDMFWYLAKKGSVENNELVQKVGVAKNALNQIKMVLSYWLQPPCSKTALKKSAQEELAKFYGEDYLVEESLFSFLISGEAYQKALKILTKYHKRRPFPKREYDQFAATPQTVGKRVALLDFFGEVRGKRILFLGDDDFTSIGTAGLGTAAKIVVIDIDRRILKTIGEIARELNLKIELVEHDLRKPLPPLLRNNFDTVFTDPPYTFEGVKLFISRAAEALDKTNQGARIYICYGNSDRAKERFLPIQEIITASGLLLRWVFDKFNRYEGAQSIGNTSSLYITEVTPKTKPLIRGVDKKPIYTLGV